LGKKENTWRKRRKGPPSGGRRVPAVCCQVRKLRARTRQESLKKLAGLEKRYSRRVNVRETTGGKAGKDTLEKERNLTCVASESDGQDDRAKNFR